jgi:hypothetical protein
VRFVDGLPTRHEAYYFLKGRDPDNLKLEEGSLLARTDTVWEKVGPNRYPSRMSSVQYNNPFEGKYLKYEARIKCFDHTTPEFIAEKTKLSQLLATAIEDETKTKDR